MSARRTLEKLLWLLVTLLVFEGFLRRLVGGGSAGLVIFFGKDLVCLVMLGLVAQIPTNEVRRRLAGPLLVLALGLLPLIVYTATHGPVLAVFGAKQHLLWSVVALASVSAYLPDRPRQLFGLLTWLALLVIPTTLMAVYQQRLPAEHWLNASPDGTSLSGFSSAGFLRVSATFSFVAQYGMFLNALCYALPAAFSAPSRSKLWALIKSPLVLLPLMLVGIYITGSRSAVVGSATIVLAGLPLLLVRGGSRAMLPILGLMVIGVISLLVAREQFPEFFAAYDERSRDREGESHTENVIQRVSSGMLDWVGGSWWAPATFFGYGLGVMSNGSERVSSYAAEWREGGFWTETDQATVLFEGGYYLIVLWYGFRLWVIWLSLSWVMAMRQPRLILPAAFAAGLVVVMGVVGTLSIQPPQAIWWWLAVGTIGCLHQFDAVHPRAVERKGLLPPRPVFSPKPAVRNHQVDHQHS
jgi:hypothetical protein